MVGKKRCFVMQSLLQLSPMPSAAAPAKVSCSRAYARYSEARIEAGRDCGGKQDEETELRAQMLDVRLFMQYDGMISVYTVPEKVVELSLPSMIDDWRRLATKPQRRTKATRIFSAISEHLFKPFDTHLIYARGLTSPIEQFHRRSRRIPRTRVSIYIKLCNEPL